MAKKTTRHVADKRRRAAKPALVSQLIALQKPTENKDVDNIIIKIPDPPACLDEIAMHRWHQMVAVLEPRGLITEMYVMPLALYCENYSIWEQASMEIKKVKGGGLLLKGKGKDAGLYRNPWLDIRNRAEAEMYKYFALFGFSPADHAKLLAGKPAKPPGKSDNAFANL